MNGNVQRKLYKEDQRTDRSEDRDAFIEGIVVTFCLYCCFAPHTFFDGLNSLCIKYGGDPWTLEDVWLYFVGTYVVGVYSVIFIDSGR